MENPSILSHVSVGTNDFEKATAFYDAVLKVTGATRIMEHPGAVAYGKEYPEFWVNIPVDEKPATLANGVHFSFVVDSKAKVDEFYKVALEHGASDNGPPGDRPHYGEPYYGCFVKDLDGHNIEATFWDEEMAKSLVMME